VSKSSGVISPKYKKWVVRKRKKTIIELTHIKTIICALETDVINQINTLTSFIQHSTTQLQQQNNQLREENNTIKVGAMQQLGHLELLIAKFNLENYLNPIRAQ
jgi:hypothetical protein